MHQRAFVLVFLRTDMSNTPKASHPVMLSGCPTTTHHRCPVCLPHHSRPAASAASPVPKPSLGRCWLANVTGSHFISSLIDRLNVSVVGGLGFTPQVFLSPLNYPRVLGYLNIPGAEPLIFLRLAIFSLGEFLVCNQPC